MKYLIVIAKYKDWKQEFFENFISPRNKEFCSINNYEYIEITNDTKLELFRNHPTWWKFTVVQDLLKNANDGDIISHIDADMIIVDKHKDFASNKSFTYAIDCGNTHCMGLYSIKVNDWSRNMIDMVLDETRFNTIGKIESFHEAFNYKNCFWDEFREQASWYSLAGIKRHSWISFFALPNYGWHSDKNEYTYYSLDDLFKHVEILPPEWNATEMIGESNCNFNINKVEKDKVIIRHFAGGQPWRKEWLQN